MSSLSSAASSTAGCGQWFVHIIIIIINHIGNHHHYNDRHHLPFQGVDKLFPDDCGRLDNGRGALCFGDAVLCRQSKTIAIITNVIFSPLEDFWRHCVRYWWSGRQKNVKAIRKSELERRQEVRSDPPRVQGHQDLFIRIIWLKESPMMTDNQDQQASPSWRPTFDDDNQERAWMEYGSLEAKTTTSAGWTTPGQRFQPWPSWQSLPQLPRLSSSSVSSSWTSTP